MQLPKSVLRLPWLRLKRFVRRVIRRDPWHGRDVRISRLRLGTAYGGWTVCPDLLDADSIIYSFGVGEDISFDLALIERFGATVHAFDPTPRVADWIAMQELPEQFVFHPLGIASEDGTVRFYPPPNPEHVSHSVRRISSREGVDVPVRRLSSIMAELGHEQIDLLKMDVEGAEYEVVPSVAAMPVGQLLIEFHHGAMASRIETASAVAHLRENEFLVFDIAVSGYEYGFVKEHYLWNAPER